MLPPLFSSLVLIREQDNTINQRVLKRQLTAHHFEVTLASNGREALDALEAADQRQSGPIDICLMDIEMSLLPSTRARSWC